MGPQRVPEDPLTILWPHLCSQRREWIISLCRSLWLGKLDVQSGNYYMSMEWNGEGRNRAFRLAIWEIGSNWES